MGYCIIAMLGVYGVIIMRVGMATLPNITYRL
ncbi:hypothetical protein F-LCD7_0441 [Faustovirus]|nr:hypothetical protein F-LCD7_0441 [Faustovirus]